VQDQEIADALDLEIALAIELVDVGLAEAGVREEGDQARHWLTSI